LPWHHINEPMASLFPKCSAERAGGNVEVVAASVASNTLAYAIRDGNPREAITRCSPIQMRSSARRVANGFGCKKNSKPDLNTLTSNSYFRVLGRDYLWGTQGGAVKGVSMLRAPSTNARRCRKENPMIGALAGDVIGSVYEWNNIKTKRFELFSPSCSFTDDSVLTVALPMRS
jgi:hypothetical protein